MVIKHCDRKMLNVKIYFRFKQSTKGSPSSGKFVMIDGGSNSLALGWLEKKMNNSDFDCFRLALQNNLLHSVYPLFIG